MNFQLRDLLNDTVLGVSKSDVEREIKKILNNESDNNATRKTKK